MATATAPAAIGDAPEKTEKQTKAYAVEVEKKLKDVLADEMPRAWTIAELISEVHSKHVWKIRGYAKVEDFREAISDISHGSWFEKRRVWDEFGGPAIEREVITRARLNRMKMQNAKQLCRLPESKRFSAKWIEYALNLKESQLEAKVDHVLENEGADESTLGEPEAIAILKIRCTTSQKDLIIEVINEWAAKQDPPEDPDNQGRCLELIMADLRSGL